MVLLRSTGASDGSARMTNRRFSPQWPEPKFPKGGIDTLVLFTRTRLTAWGVSAMGLLRSARPAGHDPDDPEDSILPPFWDQSDAARNGKPAEWCGYPVRLVRFRTKRYQHCFGIYDVDSQRGPRLLFTVRLNSMYDPGRSSITVHRVAWRFGDLSDVWSAVRTIFTTEPSEAEVYQVDIFAIVPRAFKELNATLVGNGNASFEQYSRKRDVLWHTHPIPVDRRRRPEYANEASLVDYYNEATGATIGRRSGERFLRIYDPATPSLPT